MSARRYVRFKVSDHAMLRWIDRVERIGVEAVRDRLGGLDDGELLHHLGAEMGLPVHDMRRRIVGSLFDVNAPQDGIAEIGGVLAILVEGTVVTTYPKKPGEARPKPRGRSGPRFMTRETRVAVRRERGGNRGLVGMDAD
ncbi:hypothetical protein [Aureimonas sp. AU40]|uniref:hypothetical protein n=1 Tax=Aureimonas sp. AU40 TaxID=1637747 RepID=UPI00078665E5|nr:hypothetical protein [Aureimonas sp. AU40]